MTTPASELLKTLIPLAAVGLEGAGVTREEVVRYLGIFAARVASGVTGAVWQLRTLTGLEAGGMPREAALAEMTRRYAAEAAREWPVHTWPAGR